MSFTPADISQKGVVKNILSLNHTPSTALKEYLNNVLGKNTNPGYEISFNLKKKDFGGGCMFEFIERNACGFTALNEIQSAFTIAESERIGVNNMGYGIYAPLTINSDHNALGMFIQDTEKGRFISVVSFDPSRSTISTFQDRFEGTSICGQDVRELIVPGGTRSVWYTSPGESSQTDDVGSSIKQIRGRFNVFKSISNEKGDVEAEILELSKFYNYSLVNGIDISYGDIPLLPMDILTPDEGRPGAKEGYEISVKTFNSVKNYRIRSETEDIWYNFTKDHKKSIGKPSERRSHGVEQKAFLTVYDIDIPLAGRDNTIDRKLDRKIWVEMDNTFLFCEDFPLNDYPNIRVVLKLNNESENQFDWFISPDANKSNSKIHPEMKARINELVKFTIKGKRGMEFYRASREHHGTHVNPCVQVSQGVKRDVWKNTFPSHSSNFLGAGECTQEGCTNEMNVWEYDLARCDEDTGDDVKNLRPICKPCGKERV